MFNFEYYVQKVNFEWSQIQRMDVALPEVYLFEL